MRNLGMKFTRPGKRLQFANLNMGNSWFTQLENGDFPSLC
jgi:hypothetical protein